MARSMTLYSGGSSVTVNLPKYGYTAEIHMPITTQKACDGSYSFFDPRNPDTTLTGSYDYRICKGTFWNDPTIKAALNAFLLDPLGGRACTFGLSLGSDSTGFFPGGADWGDKGNFEMRIVTRDQTGAMSAPWLWFQDDVQLIITEHPAYTLPAQFSQGNFEIGSIQNLMMPQGWFKPKTDYNFDTGLSVSGVPHSLDSTSASDTWESSWDQDLNTGNAAALINYLITNRDLNMALVAPSNFYPFGVDQGDNGIYSVKFLGSENTGREIIISVKHIGHNQWVMPVNVWLKEKLS
jgi:hypothetical protein